MATVNKKLIRFAKQCSKAKFSFWVVAEWNEAITEGLYNGRGIFENKVPAEHIIRWNVPGRTFELFMDAKNAANSKRRCCNSYRLCDSRHFDFVCEGVAQGIKDLNVQTDIPVILCSYR
jgi:6,7-dimethyl-8-ribityllumazine synthase